MSLLGLLLPRDILKAAIRTHERKTPKEKRCLLCSDVLMRAGGWSGSRSSEPTTLIESRSSSAPSSSSSSSTLVLPGAGVEVLGGSAGKAAASPNFWLSSSSSVKEAPELSLLPIRTVVSPVAGVQSLLLPFPLASADGSWDEEPRWMSALVLHPSWPSPGFFALRRTDWSGIRELDPVCLLAAASPAACRGSGCSKRSRMRAMTCLQNQSMARSTQPGRFSQAFRTLSWPKVATSAHKRVTKSKTAKEITAAW